MSAPLPWDPLHWRGYAIRDLTIGRVLADRAADNGDKPFLVNAPDGRVMTYREINAASNRVAHGLRSLGISHGAHVAVMMENSPEAVLAYFAIGKIGAVAVPINTAARGRLLAYYLTHSDATAVIADGAFALRLEEVLPATQVRTMAFSGERDSAGMTLGTVVDFASLLRAADSAFDSPVRFSDPAFIMYTSGTTGPSKGVVFTQARALMWERDSQESYGYGPDDRYFVCLPMFHAAALLGMVWLMPVIAGSIALTPRFSASKFWDEVRKTLPTICILMGSMATILRSAPEQANDADNPLRFVRLAPFPNFAGEFERRFGVEASSGYGLSDYGTPTRFFSDDPVSKRGSMGRPAGGWQIRIVDDDDFPLPPGQVGEIVLYTPHPWHASSGYYKMPEETLRAMRNGWFHTGDRGYVDEDGYFFFLDRKKDAIRRRGENISAFEVEQILLMHPAVQDAAVYAIPSELGEDDVAASIVLKQGARTGEIELLEHCAQNMAYYMVPRYVQLLSDLPRTLSGKVEKYKLREAVNADPGKLWDRERAGVHINRRTP